MVAPTDDRSQTVVLERCASAYTVITASIALSAPKAYAAPAPPNALLTDGARSRRPEQAVPTPCAAARLKRPQARATRSSAP